MCDWGKILIIINKCKYQSNKSCQRSYEIITVKFFVSTSNKFTLWDIKRNFYILKTKFTPHKHYLFGLLFSRNAKKTHTGQIYYKIFYPVWKKTSYKPSKVKAAKRFFSQVSMFHMIIGRHCFLYKFIVTQKFFATAILLRSLKQVFWNGSLFYLRYLHYSITMLLIPKVQTKSSKASTS